MKNIYLRDILLDENSEIILKGLREHDILGILEDSRFLIFYDRANLIVVEYDILAKKFMYKIDVLYYLSDLDNKMIFDRIHHLVIANLKKFENIAKSVKIERGF